LAGGRRHKPTLLGEVDEARREERGGVAEEQWKTKDLHPQHSGRPDGERQRRRHLQEAVAVTGRGGKWVRKP
jgi:hypothetical protein